MGGLQHRVFRQQHDKYGDLFHLIVLPSFVATGPNVPMAYTQAASSESRPTSLVLRPFNLTATSTDRPR